MKWLGYVLIAGILAAFITSPSQKRFEKFIATKMDTTVCKPFIYHKAYGLFSLHLFTISNAKECQKINRLQSMGGMGIPVYGKEENYLGLFGKFWKI